MRRIVLIFCFLFLTVTGCDIFQVDNGDQNVHHLGLSEVYVEELHLTDEYVYAAANQYGLYRLPLHSMDSTEWEYLGFRDTASKRGIADVHYDPINDHLWVANNSDREGKFEEGAYRSTDNGES